MGYLSELFRSLGRSPVPDRASPAAQAANQRSVTAAAARAAAAEGRAAGDAAGDSVRAAVLAAQQGALRANPATAVSVEAGYNPAARNPNVQAPVAQARSKPVAEQVADDLEQTLLEAMDIRADADGVLGVNEQVFADLERRLQAIGSGGGVEREAVQILARRYGVPEGASLREATTTISEGLAGQRMSLYPTEANVVPTDGSRRILDDPFPERPTSLEGAPPADELFEPIEVTVTERIPRFERDPLGRIKVDGEGNPLARLSPDNKPTFEAVQRRRLMPHRVSDGQPVDAGEFMVIGRRRNTSDGNQSPEEVVFVLDRGDGTYQVSRPAAEDSPARAAGGQYDSQIVDQNQLGRLMVENEYGHISGPELGFDAVAPTVGEAESLGRMLAESMRPGASTPEQVAEVVRQIDGLGDLFDGALQDRAMQAAGFQQPGNEMAFGRQLLDEARALATPDTAARASWMTRGPKSWDERPSLAEADAPPPPSQPADPSIDPYVANIRPPAALPGRGSGVEDVAGDAVRRARDMSQGQGLLTADERAARQLAENTVSGPTDAVTDVVAGPAGEMFVPEFPTFNPADQFADPAPFLYPPEGQFREGVLSGLTEVRPPRGGESMSMGEMSPASVIDTAIPAQTATMPAESAVPMPDELDVLRGLSDVAQPDTPVMNFQATPGSWAEGVSGRPVDVGGVDVARVLEPDDADFARRAWTDLSNREAAARVLSERFPYIEDTEDLADIFRRMEQAGELEPAFRDLDATEQFQMAQMSADELRELATELADEMAQTVNPNTLTQSQSVSAPTTDMDDLAARVRQARGTTTSPGALFDITGRSIPVNQQGWPAGTESWSASAANPAAPAQTRTPADPSRVAFGFDNASGGVRRARTEQQMDMLQAQLEAARRKQTVLDKVERMWDQADSDGNPTPPTTDQVVAFVRGDGDWYRLPENEQRRVLEAVQTQQGTYDLNSAAIEESKTLRRQLEGQDARPRSFDDPEAAPDIAAPDNVTDIEGLRETSGAELETADANAAFARENIPSDRGISLRRAQQIVKERLGLQRGDRLPLAFRGYDSRFSRRISESDVAQLRELSDFINKYDRMSPEEYAQLRQRNTDLPRDKDEHVQRLGAEFKALARQVSLDTIQDVDASGVNQARLVQELFSENPQVRLNALRELFDVTVQGRKRPNDDGLTVLQRLADDPAYGSIENVLYDVLRRDPAINDPEAMSSRILDEAGQPVSAASMGPESLRSAAGTLAEDARRFASRTVSPEELRATGIDPTFQPAAPDAPEIRPSFIDRLLGRRPEEPAPPQVVTRQGLDNAAEQIAAARTPEDMNAILAEINSTRDRVLSQLDDSNDPPVMDGPDASAPTTRPGWAGEVEVRSRETPGVERSARQQIMERAEELTEQWRRRMEQIQRGGDPETPRAVADASYEIEGNDAFSAAFAEARSGGAPMEEAIAAGNAARQKLRERGGRQFTAEEADAAALPGGQAPSQLRPLTRGQAAQDLSLPRAAPGPRQQATETGVEPRRPVEGVDREAVESLAEQRFRNQSLHPVDPAQLAADGLEVEVSEEVAMSVEYELRRRARASQIAAEQGGQPQEWVGQLPAPLVNLRDMRGGVRFVDETGNDVVLEGKLRSRDEPEPGGTEPWIISWSPDGSPQVRRRIESANEPSAEWLERQAIREAALSGNTRRILALIPPAPASGGAAEAVSRSTGSPRQAPEPEIASVNQPTARTDEEILDEFANPAGGPDEARIGGDIDESVRATGDPDIDAPANDYTYEGTPFVEDGPLSPGPGRTPRKSDGKPPRSLIKKATRYGVVGGLGLTGIQGGRMALAPFLAPTGIGYGAQDPMAAEGDINTAGDPAGSRVRRARQQIVYGTSQNRLPY